MLKQTLQIAIDGPAGAGKSSVAKVLAKRLNCIYLDTGAMYRAVTWLAMQQNIAFDDLAALGRLLETLQLQFKEDNGVQRLYCNGVDVTEAIRSTEVSANVSAIAMIPLVREALVAQQQRIAADCDVLMDGRDIGTVVLPNATVKIFLTATPEARAERRYKELLMKGEKHDYQNVLADVRARDYQDTHRAAAPLRQAEDAVLVDTSELNFDQSFEALKKVIQDRAK